MWCRVSEITSDFTPSYGANFNRFCFPRLFVNMPRDYKCRKWGNSHQPPTGKRCPHRDEPVEAAGENDIMSMLRKMQEKLDSFDGMKEQMDGIVDRVSRVEFGSEGGSETQQTETQVVAVERQDEGASGSTITPESLRSDVKAMQRAAQRIASYRMDDEDDFEEDEDNSDGTRKNGKKSGSLRLAADKVKRDIDWPHLHINRVVAGKRVPVAYKELRIEEFVFGFLEMLDSERRKWDRDLMLNILKMCMQDAMDFSWENARAFYRLVGVDVESGVRGWTDTDGIRDLRMLHSRIVYPEAKENKEIKKGQSNKVPANSKCCALYQKKACEQHRDHHPFTHACAFCARITGMLYRHPEEDCFRKSIDEAKNSKKRE